MSQQRFDHLGERLLRAGIAPRHVRRYLSELCDHLYDMVREETEKGLVLAAAKEAAQMRLSSDDALAVVMMNRPELRSITARYPWAVFGITPVLTLLAILFAATFGESVVLNPYLSMVQEPGTARLPPPDWLEFSVAAFNGLMTGVTPLGIAAILWVIGTKQRMSARWVILGVAVICVAGGFFEMEMSWPGGPSPGELSLGFGVSPQYPQFYRAAINLAVAGAAYWWWPRPATLARTQ